MYDESIQRALKRHKIVPITLPAPLVMRLVENFQADAPASHIITGTAGDGKTYHCREVWVALGGDPATWNEGAKIQTLAIGSRSLVIVKDMSELRDEESAQLIANFARDVADRQASTFYLLAANHGQLLEKLKSAPHTPEIERVTTVVEELLVTGNNPDPAISVDLDDLSRSPAAEMVATIIDEVTSHEGWEGCGSCAANMGDTICPIYENRRRLTGEGEGDAFKRRIAALIELSERNGSHFPVRQLLALVANSILGHPEARDGLMSCAEVPRIVQEGKADASRSG